MFKRLIGILGRCSGSLKSCSHNNSAIFSRANSSANLSILMILVRNSPLSRAAHANALCFLPTNNAATRFVSLSSSNAESVNVPAVMIRTTLRSTTLPTPTSPTCSQIATLRPSFTSFAKYCSTE